MRAAFSAPSRVEVTLSRPGPDRQEGGKVVKAAGEQITLVLASTPIGFREYLELVYPRPLAFVNGKPEGIDPKKGPGWAADLQLILLGKSLGDQVDTAWPKDLTEAALREYVRQLRAELEAANLTPGDINRLLLGLEQANAGMGRQRGAAGNAEGPAS